MDFQGVGKILILSGAFLASLGLLLFFWQRIPFLGKLPGDIRIEKPGFTLYIPVTTCLILSAILSGLLWILSKWR